MSDSSIAWEKVGKDLETVLDWVLENLNADAEPDEFVLAICGLKWPTRRFVIEELAEEHDEWRGIYTPGFACLRHACDIDTLETASEIFREEGLKPQSAQEEEVNA